jgi:PAS domain S-box-containing protein
VSQVIAILVIALGLVVFIGWGFNLPALTYIQPAFEAMRVNTALSFVFLGAVLWLIQKDSWRRSRRVLALIVASLAALTLAEYAFHIDLGIDQLLFPDRRTPLDAFPGRTGSATAICFLLMGLAITLREQKKALALQRALVGGCFVLSLVALCGYLYGVRSLYTLPSFSTMAPQTAAGLFAACLAYSLARPGEGIMSIAASRGNAGFLLRTLVPAIVIVPVLIGWLGVEGHKANLYDAQFGVVLQVLGSVGCLTVLTVLVVRSVNRFEQDRARVAEALKKSEEKFSKAFRESPAAVALTSMRDHHYLDVSESFERWSGWRRDEVIGRTPDAIGIWAEPSQRMEFVDRLLADGIVRNMEVRYRRKDGVEGVVLGSGELIEIEGEQYIISAVADISDRKRAEQALIESEQRFRLLADTAPALIWMSGTDKLCTYFNKPWLDFTGRTIERELGNGWAEGVHREDFKRCLETYERAFDRREEFRMEYRLRRHDGEYRWILDIGSPRFGQEHAFLGYIGIAIDVTERKLADDARFRLAAIVESSDDAIIGLDTQGTVRDWNKGAERLYGYSAEEAKGRHVSFLSPTERPNEGQEILEKVLSGETVQHFETVRRRKDGICIDVSLTASPIVDIEGGIVGASGIALDITERKRAEAQRLLSENRFRQFFETSPEYCYMVSPNGEIMDINSAVCASLGYTREELVGKPMSIIYAPESRLKVLELLSRSRAEGQIRGEEIVIATKHGQKRTVLLNTGAVRDSDGNILHSTSVQVDITARKRAEEALRQSEEQFRTLAEAIPQLCWIAHNDGRIFWYNQRCYTYTGATRDELERWGWQLAHDPQSVPTILERRNESISRGEPFDMVVSLKGADGLFRPFLTRVMPLKNAEGEVVRWFGTSTDVTALREAHETRYRQLFENTLEGIARCQMLFDDHGSPEDFIYLEVNSAFSMSTGLEDVVGKRMTEVVPGISESNPELFETCGRVARTGQPEKLETEIKPLGIWLSMSVHSPERDQLVAVFDNITERKRSEEALLRAEKLASVGRMAAAIAHEINNPLEAVMNLLFLAVSTGELSASARQLLETADEELRRVAYITRQALGFYRESNAPALTSVSVVLDSAINLLKSRIKAKHALIDAELDKDVQIIAVAGELRQVFSNLLSNSLDAIDERGVIKLRLSSRNNHVRVTIADNGKGIPRDIRGRIFEALFTTKSSVGTGLGLWVSQQIIEKHKGTIRVRSSSDDLRRGTTFCISLPVQHPGESRLSMAAVVEQDKNVEVHIA